MPAAAGRVNWVTEVQDLRDAWRRLSGGSRPGRRGEKNKNKNIFGCKRLQSMRRDAGGNCLSTSF
jgi:hypothetical protein